jgi:methylenetetrahydrofolate reductase (NADPH)
VDLIKGIAAEAFADGRVSAVSITDNPGGNPSLSPDVIGHEMFDVGMDVIIHFACRDLNRAGLESRALQLAMMGMKNILALTGDYTSRGFGGPGTPVFDLDSVTLLAMLNLLSDRIATSGDPDGFFPGAVVSPFKYTEEECFVQYAKLCRKVATGAQFIITQLGYDVQKFLELRRVFQWLDIQLPLIGSVYLLSPRAARAMNRGSVPGAVVPDGLLEQVLKEWKSPPEGLALGIERAARLGAVLKGIGYRGIQIGGIHRSFKAVGRILDRMEEIGPHWQDYVSEFNHVPPRGFYLFPKGGAEGEQPRFGQTPLPLKTGDIILFRLMQTFHRFFFDQKSPLAPWLGKSAEKIDRRPWGKKMVSWAEKIPKKILLGCQECGDCAIQHLAFLCPESQCPKHTRNGGCGGGREGRCEVNPERPCVWVRAYRRWLSLDRTEELISGCVPPRMWELNHSSSWLNFHLKRDHQSSTSRVAQFCRSRTCPFPKKVNP